MNGQRQAGQPERGDDRPSGGQVGDDGQQRRPGRPPGPAEHPGPQDAETGRVRYQHRGDGHRDSPCLGLAERLFERLAQQRRVVRAHLEREMRQRRAPVRAGGQRVVHQRRGVTGPGPGGLVAPGPAVPFPPQPPLAVQVLHDRHHGGVSQRPVVMQSVDHLADQHRPAPLPQPIHDHGFQLTETSHPHSRTWLCQTARPPLPTITHRTTLRFRCRPFSSAKSLAQLTGWASGPGSSSTGAATGEHNTFTIRVSRHGCYHRCSPRRAGRRPRCRHPRAVLALCQGPARLRRAVLPGPGERGRHRAGNLHPGLASPAPAERR